MAREACKSRSLGGKNSRDRLKCEFDLVYRRSVLQFIPSTFTDDGPQFNISIDHPARIHPSLDCGRPRGSLATLHHTDDIPKFEKADGGGVDETAIPFESQIFDMAVIEVNRLMISAAQSTNQQMIPSTPADYFTNEMILVRGKGTPACRPRAKTLQSERPLNLFHASVLGILGANHLVKGNGPDTAHSH
ncbi:hypothetical protein [Streptomyces sp. TLI_171]|uniref:hypothetical protein n=1 Tax=Streptomyces sp. TLI_171 TaxID=1938859 RepID=UPI00117D8824|nr:hypothetical protein [Streptomyces sp. TLI_171]